MRLKLIFSQAAGILRRNATISGQSSVAATQTSTADFSISAARSSVFPGEAVRLDTDNPAGFGVTVEEKELDWLWGFDQAGATFSASVPNSDANYFKGPRAVTAYATPGSYSPSCTVRSASASKTKSVAITVQDPDVDVTWDRDVYVSFAGNTTGWPAETGAVEHITSATEWRSLSFSTANEVVRITFRDDETYTWTPSDEKNLGGGDGTYYVTRDFAGTNRPKFTASATSTDFASCFKVSRTSSRRVVFYGLEIDGGYDPLTGDAPNGTFQLLEGIGPAATDQNAEITINSCVSTGANCAKTEGTVNANGPTYFSVLDSTVEDWPDYGFGLFGGIFDARFSGCNLSQNPLALLRDGKIGTFPQAPDHGPVRVGDCLVGVAHNIRSGSTTGWSALGVDRAVQNCFRFHPISTTQPWDVLVHDCDFFSGFNVTGVGDVNSSITVSVSGRFMFNCNRMVSGRQNRTILLIKASGGTIMNNVFYLPNLSHPIDAPTGVKIENNAGGSNVRERDIYVGFNTFVSDRVAGDFFAVNAGSWGGPGAITQEHNLVYAPNHTNAGDYTDHSPVSRADNFKPVNTSAAVDAVTTGFVPVRDFDGNLRTSTTNVGAHHDNVASDAGISAVSNSVAPTIAELSGTFPGEYAVSNLGTWANDEPYWISWKWQMDGVDVAVGGNAQYAEFTTCDVSALDDSTGNLTCIVTMTNLNGTSVTATSNTIAV